MLYFLFVWVQGSVLGMVPVCSWYAVNTLSAYLVAFATFAKYPAIFPLGGSLHLQLGLGGWGTQQFRDVRCFKADRIHSYDYKGN
jgi:hypothetical protein